jgi:hypothetical protein
MSKQVIDLTLPDYLTISQYVNLNGYKGTSNFGRLVHTVSAISGYEKAEVRKWSLSSLTDLANHFGEIADHKQEFHSVIEWNGKLYGYAPVKASTLGEYVDLENLVQDFEANAHKVAAIFYRPIKSHRFKSLEFHVKQKIKMLKNKVENVFDWYTTETYDSDKRKLVEEEFKDFPAHIFLGALSFFLSTVNLYSTNILFLEKKITKTLHREMMTEIMDNLSLTTGAGGGLFTNSLSPVFYKLQETSPLLT